MMNLVNFKFLGKKMAMSITKKHNASFSSSILSSLSTPTFPKQPILPKNDSSSILSSLSTPTFPKQPILPKNDFNSIVVSRSLSEDPSRAVNFFIEKKLKGFKFDMRIYPSLIYACVRVNSIGTLSAVLADYVKKGLNLHVDSEELSLTSKVLRGEKVERSRLAVAATAGKHLLTINNLMRAFCWEMPA